MKTTSRKQGGALVMVTVVLLAVSAMVIGLYKMQNYDGVEAVRVELSNKAFWLAETGLQRGLHELRENESYRDSPYELSETAGDGSYTAFATVANNTNFTVISTGTVNGVSRVVQLNADLRVSIDLDNFEYALIGLNGNQSKLNKDGTIDGSVYSAGELWVNGRASPTVNGDIYAEDGRNVDFTELSELDVLDMEIDSSPYDFSISGSSPTYTNMTLKGVTGDFLDLSGGKTVKVTGTDLDLSVGTWGDGTLIVDNGDLTFETQGDPYYVDDGATIMVDGDIKGQKDGEFGSGVTIYTTGNMELQKTGTGEDTTFLIEGDFTGNKDLDLLGLLFVAGTAQIDGDLTLEGALVAGDYWLKGGYDLTYNPNYLDGNVIISNVVAVRSGSWRELPTT